MNPNDRGLILNARNVGGAQSNSQVTVLSKGKDGWISRVGVQASQYCPRGRVYCTVSVIPASNPVPIVLWAGYIRAIEAPPSYPSFYSTADDQIQAVFTFGTNTTNPVDYFQAAVDYQSTKDYLSPPVLFNEPPFSGPGEVLTNHVAAIAHGTDESYTIPGFVRQRIRSVQGRLTTSAVVNNRVPQPNVTDAAGNQLVILDGTYGEKTAAGSAQTYCLTESGWPFGELIAESTAQFTLSHLNGLGPIPQNYVFSMNTENFDTTAGTGDQWTNVNFNLEEWAGPNP